MGEERKVYKVLVGKPEGKRPLGRPRRGWEDRIRMDLREIGLGDVDCIRGGFRHRQHRLLPKASQVSCDTGFTLYKLT
jgi:hypothetical protein